MNLARREPRWAVIFTVLLALIAAGAAAAGLAVGGAARRSSRWSSSTGASTRRTPAASSRRGSRASRSTCSRATCWGRTRCAIALVAYIAMSLHQRLRNQTLVQQSLFVFAVLTLNEFVVWGIEGWSGHAVAVSVALDPADDRRHVVAVRRVAGRPHALA